jgi:hypothetical protein
VGSASTIQNGFNAGELSALLLGRQDLDKYASGLYVCLNAVPLVQGAWTRRPGTAFLHQTKHHDRLSRVLPFQFSVTQTYILEFGHLYIRFFTDHGILTNATQAITGVTRGATTVLAYSGADTFANGDRIIVAGIVGTTQLNNREFIVAAVDTGANTFEITDTAGVAINSTNYTAYVSGGTVGEILQVTTTYTESEVADIRITQSADTLYIMHPTHKPAKLVRASALSWTLSDIVFTDGPYDVENTTTTTLTPSAATGAGVTLTASAVTGINGGLGFASTDVGRLIRIKEGSTWGYVEITGWTSTTIVTVTVLSTLTNTNAKTIWRMGVFSATTGYPRCATFHEDRLWYAGATSYPQRIDGSKTGNYTNFSPSATDGTVAADNAPSFTMNADDVNAVRWITAQEKGMLAGTSRGEWQIRPSSLNEAITPQNISGKPSTRHGSDFVQPVNAGKAVLFVQRAGRKIRELAYVYEVDGFKAPDMTLLAEHITRPSVYELAYQEQPQAIMWGVRGDGVLLGFTYERDHNVTAWHRHELGGQSDDDGLLIPVVESVAVVPDPDATRDELYMVVQRYINGGVKRYVEYMSKIWEVDDEQEDAFHVDCGWVTVNSPATATVTGLWHLEGETVGVYVDGTKHPDVTVTNGTVTLNRTGSIITLGYFYPSDGNTMPLEGGAEGTAQGKIKRIHRIGFWLVDTLGFKFGPDADTLTEEIDRRWGDEMGAATPLFSGVIRDHFEGDYDRLGQVYWRADGPFPATVLAVMPQFQTADDS